MTRFTTTRCCGVQETGASASVRAFWKPLRQAGAVGTSSCWSRLPPRRGMSSQRVPRQEWRGVRPYRAEA